MSTLVFSAFLFIFIEMKRERERKKRRILVLKEMYKKIHFMSHIKPKEAQRLLIQMDCSALLVQVDRQS